MKKVLIIMVSAFYLVSCNRDIRNELTKLDNITLVSESNSTPGDRNNFTMSIDQPVDHNNPNGEKFTQEFYVSHRGFDKPVVVVTDGYSVYYKYRDELAEILDANLIVINYRYYNNAIPENPDLSFLTIKQAATDHHKIVNSFKKIYKKSKWISTGISKGGMSAIYYKRFYPNDIDVVVPRVAPTFNGMADSRVTSFFNDVTRMEKVGKINELMMDVLARREKFTPLLNSYIPKNSILRKKLTNDEILELLVSNYIFNYWKNGEVDYKPVPSAGSFEPVVLRSLIREFSYVLYMSELPDAKAYMHQTFSEIGGSSYDHGELKYKYNIDELYFRICDIDSEPVFNPEILLDINTWVEENGNNILYVYGEEDPYSSYQFEIGENTNAQKFIVKDESHLFRLKDMDNYDQFYKALMDRLN